jgi:hypothetical protein
LRCWACDAVQHEPKAEYFIKYATGERPCRIPLPSGKKTSSHYSRCEYTRVQWTDELHAMGDSDASSDPEDFEYIPEGDGGRSESEQSVAGEEEEEEEERAVSTSSITTRSSQRTSTIT